MVLPDFLVTFKLHCDASKLGIRAVLSQNNRPIAFLVKSSQAQDDVTTHMTLNFMQSSKLLSIGDITWFIVTLFSLQTTMLCVISIVKQKFQHDMLLGLLFSSNLLFPLSINRAKLIGSQMLLADAMRYYLQFIHRFWVFRNLLSCTKRIHSLHESSLRQNKDFHMIIRFRTTSILRVYKCATFDIRS